MYIYIIDNIERITIYIYRQDGDNTKMEMSVV